MGMSGATSADRGWGPIIRSACPGLNQHSRLVYLIKIKLSRMPCHKDTAGRIRHGHYRLAFDYLAAFTNFQITSPIP